jgi:hypothetical protein
MRLTCCTSGVVDGAELATEMLRCTGSARVGRWVAARTLTVIARTGVAQRPLKHNELVVCTNMPTLSGVETEG